LFSVNDLGAIEEARAPPGAGDVRRRPAHLRWVVLIAFPSPELKALGFITKVMTDPDTGQ
jgi:hypothetical protein